jgi:hypothetical protein
MIQLPSTLPFNINSNRVEEVSSSNKGQENKLAQMIDRLSISGNSEEKEEPPRIGKIRVMKSGKVVLRMEDPLNKEKYVDFELIKGIPTNFY